MLKRQGRNKIIAAARQGDSNLQQLTGRCWLVVVGSWWLVPTFVGAYFYRYFYRADSTPTNVTAHQLKKHIIIRFAAYGRKSLTTPIFFLNMIYRCTKWKNVYGKHSSQAVPCITAVVLLAALRLVERLLLTMFLVLELVHLLLQVGHYAEALFELIVPDDFGTINPSISWNFLKYFREDKIYQVSF